jgi:hypothetical protein
MDHINADVTLYMQHKVGGVPGWARVVLSGVYAQQKIVRSHGSDGVLKFTRETEVRVDQDLVLFDEAGSEIVYCAPDEFSRAEEVSGIWTLKQGDVVVFGAQTQEIGPGYDIAQLRRDYGTYATIQAVSDLRGGPLGHWQVTAI